MSRRHRVVNYGGHCARSPNAYARDHTGGRIRSHGIAPVLVAVADGQGRAVVVDDDALLETFEGFATGLVNPFDVADVLNLLVDRAVEVVGVDGAGVSLSRDDALLGFVAASDVQVAEVEEHQDIRGGPCHDAFHDDTAIVVDDLDADQRWPGYRRAAEELGFRAVLAVPVPTNTGPIGALNLYCHDVHDWTAREVEVAAMMAAMASGYLLTGVALNDPAALSGQLADALASRTIVEQALGIVAGHFALDRHAAFEVVQDHARRVGSSLHVVARDIVDGGLDAYTLDLGTDPDGVA